MPNTTRSTGMPLLARDFCKLSCTGFVVVIFDVTSVRNNIRQRLSSCDWFENTSIKPEGSTGKAHYWRFLEEHERPVRSPRTPDSTSSSDPSSPNSSILSPTTSPILSFRNTDIPPVAINISVAPSPSATPTAMTEASTHLGHVGCPQPTPTLPSAPAFSPDHFTSQFPTPTPSFTCVEQTLHGDLSPHAITNPYFNNVNSFSGYDLEAILNDLEGLPPPSLSSSMVPLEAASSEFDQMLLRLNESIGGVLGGGILQFVDGSSFLEESPFESFRS